MKPISFMLIVSALFVSSCSESIDTDPNYPTTIRPIDKNEMDNLIIQLKATPIENCTEVDTFGFLIPFMKKEVCIDSSWRANYTYNELVAIAQKAVVDYKGYLKVENPKDFEVKTILTDKGIEFNTFKKSYPDSLPWCWLVRSENQWFNGIEVRGTQLTFAVSPTGVVSAGGNWFNEIYIPAVTKVDADSAKKLLIGTTLEYSSSKFVVTESTTWHKPKKIIVPLSKLSNKQLRVCWALYPQNWEVLIDSETGEKVLSVNLSKVN